MPMILVTNDDGAEADGLRCLEENLQGVADIIVVAPDGERSAISHGLTIDRPLTLKNLSPNRFVLDGTPADCIIYALRNVVRARPDLVISGINHGANLGDDIMYSGTVAAAREASRFGIPALAVSQDCGEKPIRFKEGARFVRNLVEKLLAEAVDRPLCLNINIPAGRIKGLKVTRQGCSVPPPRYFDGRQEGDSRGEGADFSAKPDIMADYEAVAANYVSVTPLQRDQTDYAAAHSLMKEVPSLFEGLSACGDLG